MTIELQEIHEIYTRLSELVTKDFENLDILEDIIDSAIEYANETEQVFLTQAMNRARKERLLVELGKELLGVNDESESEAEDDTRQESKRLHIAHSQIEMMKKLMENRKLWERDEPRF